MTCVQQAIRKHDVERRETIAESIAVERGVTEHQTQLTHPINMVSS
jgi:hypothetical protein